MTYTRIKSPSRTTAVREAWAMLHLQWRALVARVSRREPGHQVRMRDLLPMRRSRLRRIATSLCVTAAVIGIPTAGLWWRLGVGPLTVDFVTPFLTSAIEERLGGRHRVEVGGTQLERTEEGHIAVRLRDIVVRDADGREVASAPKAEVGISGVSLLAGRVQAERLSLIGAALKLRVDRDGQVTVFAGGEPRQLTTAAGATALRSSPAIGPATVAQNAPAPDVWAQVLAWLDRLDSLGLDGQDLAEIGLKNGTLSIVDDRSGRPFTFENINLSVSRPKDGGIAFALSSTGADGPWALKARIAPTSNGRRAIEAMVRDISPKDLMLVMRAGDGKLEADMPISAVLKAEIGADGAPLTAEGALLLGAGYIGERGSKDDRILIDEAQLKLKWDAANRQIVVPFELQSGANRFALMSQIDVPREPGGAWGVTISRGQFILGPPDRSREPPVVLDRVTLYGRIDPVKQRFEVAKGDIAGAAAGLAFSGTLDWSSGEPRLDAGLAGTKMTAAVMKRVWPVVVQPVLRTWVIEHISAGSVDRLVMAANAPLATLSANGPPVPDEGVSIEIRASGVNVRPIETLPAIRDADLTLTTIGRNSTLRLGRGIADLPSGKKITLTNGIFEVPDTFPKAPPARAKVRMEGPLEGVAELATMEPLKDSASLQLDPASSRGSVAANVAFGLPLRGNLDRNAVSYAIDAEVTNFAAEKLVRSYKVEANLLRITANPQAVQVKGDVKIGGTPATVDYRLPIGNGDAEIRAQTTLDNDARKRLGFELAGVAGSVPVKLSGKIGSGDHDSRLNVELDLIQAQIADLMPGWIKPAGKAGKATFVVVKKEDSTRLEDFLIDSAGALVKGAIELDGDGEIVSAIFPTFNMSGGDQASLKIDRANDGTMKVALRGNVYDGRGFVKGAFGTSADKAKSAPRDLDLEIKIGALAGFHGEALRNVDLKLSRRNGQIRTFGLSGKLGSSGGTLIGDLRGYPNGRQVVYLESNDAGALFRFTDTYPRMRGGQMWVAMDPPNADHAPQDGLLNVSAFSVRGEPALERVATSGPAIEPGARSFAPQNSEGVSFSRMRVQFVKQPGKLTIRDGVVMGPMVGATIEGHLDYAKDSVSMSGTFVPAYALNNFFSRLPLVGGIIGGGQNEGLFGVTYEVVGTPTTPILRVNPMSAVAPGFLRKLFDFRRGEEQTAAVPPAPIGQR